MSLNFGGLGLAFVGKDSGLGRAAEGLSSAFSDLKIRGDALRASVLDAGRSFLGLDTGKAVDASAALQDASSSATAQIDKLAAAADTAGAKSEGFGRSLSDRLLGKVKKVTGALFSLRGEEEKDARSTGLLKDAVESLHRILDVERVRAWIGAFGTERIDAARDSIGSLLHANLNLTTGFEAQQQQLSQSARQLGANMGFAGAELGPFTRQVAGLANATNRGADVAAQAVANWAWAGSELRQVGFRNARELLQIQDVTGASASTVADTIRTLIRVYHLSGQQASQVLGSMTAMGQTTGDVGAALNALPQVMQTVSQEAARMGVSLAPDQLSEMVRQTASLGTALYQAGEGGQTAQETALQLSTALLNARQHMQGLMFGVQEDIAPLATSLGIATGDITRTFDVMSQGPEHFVSGLAQMVADIRERGGDVGPVLGHLSARLGEAFGPEQAAHLINFFRNADAATLRSMQAFTGTADTLRSLARQGFSTGRTLEDSFNLARDAAIASFRSIGRRDAVNVVRDMSAEFRTFNSAVRGVVREGGPLGALAERLSAAHQIGALAFIPRTLRPISILMGNLASEVGPVLIGLRQLGFSFSSLLSLLTPVLVGLGLLAMRFIDLRMHGRSTGEAVDKIADSLSQGLRDLPGVVSRAFDYVASALRTLGGVDWRGVWARLLDEARAAFRELKPQFADLGRGFLHELTSAVDGPSGRSSAGSIGAAVGRVLRSGVKAAWGYLSNTVVPAAVSLVAGLFLGVAAAGAPANATEALGAQIGAFLRDAFVRAVSGARDYLFGWWGAVSATLANSSRPLTDRLASVVGSSTGLGLVAAVVGVVVAKLGLLAPAFALVSTAVEFLVANPITALVAGVAALTAGFLLWPQRTEAVVARVGNALRSGTALLFDAVTTGVGYVVGGVAWLFSNLPRLVLTYAPVLLAAVGRALGAVVGLVGDIVHGALDGIERALVRFFPESAATIHRVFQGLHVAFGMVLGLVQGAAAAVAPVLTGVVTGVSLLVRGVARLIGGVLSGVGSLVVGAFGAIYHGAEAFLSLTVGLFRTGWRFVSEFFSGLALLFTDPLAGLRQMGGAYEHLFSGIVASFGDFFRHVFESGRSLFEGLWGFVGGILRGVGGLLGGLWGAFSSVVGGLLRGVGAFVSATVASWGQTFDTYLSGMIDAVSRFIAYVVDGWTGLGSSAEYVIDGIRAFFVGLAASALGTLSGLWAWITESVSGLPGTVSTYFSQIVETIRADIEQAVGFVTGFKDRFVEALDGVWNRVVSLFGNSVHDVVGEDLAQTNAISSQWSDTFQGHATQAFNAVTERSGEAQAAATQFQNLLARGLVDVLVGAFTTGYAAVMARTTTFLAELSRLFQRFALAVATQYTTLWSGIADLADQTLRSIERQVLDATAGLTRLAALADRARTLQSATAPAGADAQATARALGRAANETDLYGAIHEPDWYVRDYRDRFDRKMDELIAAVRAGGAQAPRGGSRDSAQGQTRTAAELQARGQQLAAALGGS